MGDSDHKKVWGHGFRAGQEDYINKHRGGRAARYSTKNAMLLWNPGPEGEVEVVPWPSNERRDLMYSALCGLGNASPIERKAMVFIEAMHLIVNWKCDPIKVHKALLNLEEYRDGCSDEMLRVER
jgi:hypothetical protein